MEHPAGRLEFWRESASPAFVAASPHRPGEDDGLAAFAASREDTRGLLFFQTSGSEGLPKWVGLTRPACLASARAVNAHLESTSRDRWLIALPLHHVGGFSILARAAESGAAVVHLPDRWHPAAFTSLCQAEHITLTSLVPAQVHDLVQQRLFAPDTLRAVVVGGGGMSRDLGLRALELGWPVLQSYGMTETASQVATEPLEHLRAGFDPDSLEVLPCWTVSTTAEEHLQVRGPALASGHAVRKDGRWHWEPIDPAQGLVTRDRVQIWDHGTRRFLRFLGRASSFVKVLGELVSLPALQARLESLHAASGGDARAVLVWPAPDARTGSRLLLVGEGSGPGLESLRLRFNEISPGFERLQAVVTLPAIPRGALGKVDATPLRDLLAARGLA